MIKFLLVSLFLSQAWAHESLETSKFEDVKSKIQELRLKYSSSEILVVLDLDNTLLKAKQDLGSDQWIEWQTEAISKNTSEALFPNVDDLIYFQSHLFQMSTMALTSSKIPEIVESFQNLGMNVFVLTSRSVFLRNSTERELRRNKLWFAKSSPFSGIPFEFTELPFKRPVSLMNGVFMTSGHHKGEALRYLINKIGKKYKAIAFVDDLERHTSRVMNEFSKETNLEMITIRYSSEDSQVEKFRLGSKDFISNQVGEINQLMSRIFK